MQKFKSYLSIVLCLSLLVELLAGLSVKAVTYPVNGEIKNAHNKDVAQIYSLPGTTGHETEENKNKSQKLCDLPNGTKVLVLEEAVDGDGDKWYKIKYGENFDNEGYAYSVHVILKPEYEFDEDFEKNLENFPESYRDALRQLHAKYPNWNFVANNFDLTFKEAVEAQYDVSNVKNTRKWVEFTYGGNEWRDMRAYDTAANKWITLEARWTYASRAAIEYFMDPRNSLNENMIFAFMQQSYQADDNMQENLRTVIKGTFLENGYDKDGNGKIEGDAEKSAYVEDLIKAAQESEVSPYVLAATIIVEQGVAGESALISGKYPGFEGYYNFFNFSANGSTADEIAKSGLAYAKENGWNSREKAIVGGAKSYADGYINVGQDTYYYKDFNVVNKVWWHQYASSLYDAWTNARYLQKGCTTSTDAVITFSIPIFAQMPEEVCPAPSVVVIPDPTPTPTPTPTPPKPVIKKGDTNNDGVVNAVDLAAVKMDILAVKKLDGDARTAGDVNGDGAINAVDLAAIKMHILGVKSIS